MEPEKLLPSGENTPQVGVPVTPAAHQGVPLGVPSPAAQSWGAVISIVIIVLMIIIGAFYAWGERIAQNQIFTESATAE